MTTPLPTLIHNFQDKIRFEIDEFMREINTRPELNELDVEIKVRYTALTGHKIDVILTSNNNP